MKAVLQKRKNIDSHICGRKINAVRGCVFFMAFLAFPCLSAFPDDKDFSPYDEAHGYTKIPLPEGMKEKLLKKIQDAQKAEVLRAEENARKLDEEVKNLVARKNGSVSENSGDEAEKPELSTIEIPFLEQNPFEKLLPPFVSKLEDHNLSHIFSLDLDYNMLNFSKGGFGIGANFEQKLFSYASLKTGVSVKRELIPDSRITISSISVGLTALCYPFGKGLEWLYFGCGIGNDFQNYSGYGDIPSPAEDIVVSVLPTLGWKQMFWKMVMLDFFVGYKDIVSNSNRYADNADYVQSGFQYGIKFQIMWSRLIKTILHKDLGVDKLGKPIIKKPKTKSKKNTK